MVRLGDIVAGCYLAGLDKAQVRVIEARMHGSFGMTVIFKDGNGILREEVVDHERAAGLDIVEPALPWTFLGNGEELRLASEAWRIRNAWLFDPYLAVHTSDVEPLPHQISAVYEEMLGRIPLRFVLADDPGAGKTIMTGLLIRELQARGALKRCLIVCPGGLADQWQEELSRKFHLHFEMLGRDSSTVGGNVFREKNQLIARLDMLSRNDSMKNLLEHSEWDLVVCDEAHKMSATVFGSEVKMTKRFHLGRLLSGITSNFLLLTATPHNGKNEDFQLFLSLLDEDRFGGVTRARFQEESIPDVMRRLVKEELLKFDGMPLFPPRHAVTVNYALSPEELDLYQTVTQYVQTQFNMADRLKGRRRAMVGLALTVLQRRLASSPEAIYQSLSRRRQRMEEKLVQARRARRTPLWQQEEPAHVRGVPGGMLDIVDDPDGFDEDDYTSGELEDMDALGVSASASENVQELEAEIQILKLLESKAAAVRMSGRDRKWEELSALLQDGRGMFDQNGRREKLIIFTEHRDTLIYLEGRIRSLLGNDRAVVHIDGSMSREERRQVEVRFRQDRDVCVLVATDAAGEGLNLQQAHLMVNYDLPWNPNRLEQRFGRIHRIGQDKVCWLWNMVAPETCEGHVFQKLFEKLEQEKKALGGKVFDILGRISFDNRPLKDLLLEAVRASDWEKSRSRITSEIEGAFDGRKIRRLLKDYSLTPDVMNTGIVSRIRADMDRMEARKLQPYFIESFFREAFERLGGRMRRCVNETGRYEIMFVPGVVCREMEAKGEPAATQYERVCFDKRHREGAVQAEFLCPGHPLMEAVLSLTLKRCENTMKSGAVLVDDQDFGDRARLLFSIEDTIVDGVVLADRSRRVVSKAVHFAEIDEDGTVAGAGYAPYLDYRPATEEEQALAIEYAASRRWLPQEVEDLAMSYAVTSLLPSHLEEVREQRVALADKIEKAVNMRMDEEMRYWDLRAVELRQKEQEGKTNARINAEQARRRADELESRKKRRLEELALERQVDALPPKIVSGCLVIPAGLARKFAEKSGGRDVTGKDVTGKGRKDGGIGLGGKEKQAPCPDPVARKKIEMAAMEAVMAVERQLGFEPVDVSARKCGYDIESLPASPEDAENSSLRFIEVKGRARQDNLNVSVTKNEILAALNKPEQFILALVVVDGDSRHVVYLKRPFTNSPDFSAISTVFDVQSLLRMSEVVYEGDIDGISKETD